MSRVCIASGSQISADAGIEVANRGGNAVDAALTATLVSMGTDLGVMAPGASGFITIWPQGTEPTVIDAYAEMPGRGLEAGHFGRGAWEVSFDYGGMMSTVIGHGSVATPGMFAGLEMACKQYGTLPWAEIVAPAIRRVERGFLLSGGAAEYLNYTREAIFSWHPQSYRTLHHPDGSPIRRGEAIRLPELASSLRLIARGGADAFYLGDIGQQIAGEMRAGGGLLTAADLAAYQARERSPVRILLDDWEVVTTPLPAIGGSCLAAMLLLVDRQRLEEWNASALRSIVEIQKAVLDYRFHHLEGVSEGRRKAEVARLLELAGVGNPQALTGSPETIHVSAADSNGLACSVTASAGYGSGVMVEDTGLWLNNSLGEIELHPQGLQGLSPGTRLTSNMAPTVARHTSGAVLAIGSPGASRITTAIFQVLLNYIHLKMPLSQAIGHPRLHIERFEGHPAIAFEAGLPMESIEGFSLRQFSDLSMYFGGVQAALWHPTDGLSAVADPRRTGGVAWQAH